MANVTYTIQSGDTLSSIASRYNTSVESIMALNPDIVDAAYIAVGDTIIISGTKTTTKTAVDVEITKIAIQNGTTRNVFAVWTWDKPDTDHYSVQWQYYTGNGIWFPGDTTTVNNRVSVYSAQNNYTKVRVRVKPIAKAKSDSDSDPKWTAGWCEWVVYKFSGAVKATDKLELTDLGIQNGTDRTLYITWKWNKDHTDSYRVEWEYATGNGTWFPQSEQVEEDRVSTYNAPSNAVKVRVRVKAVSKTRNNGNVYWTADWSDWDTYTFASEAAPEKIDAKVELSQIKIQSGTERNMFVTWKWSQSHTEGYEVEWEYGTGDGVWFDGSNVTENTKQSVYSAQNNYTKVRVRVKPISATNSSGKLYWTADWCEWDTYTLASAAAPPKVTTKAVIGDMKPQSGSIRNLFMTWSWDRSHTDKFEIQWRVATGDGVWFGPDAGGNDQTVYYKQASFSAPDNALKVRARVKPIAEDQSNGKAYWTADWGDWKYYTISEPVAPRIDNTVVMSPLYIESGTERTLKAVWTWNKSNTDTFKVQWRYKTVDNDWLVLSDNTSGYKQDSCDAPANASAVRVRVLPVAETHKVNGVDTSYWVADWCKFTVYNFLNPPAVPSVPTVTVNDKLKITISNTNIAGADPSTNTPAAKSIEYQIVKDDSSNDVKTVSAKISTSAATYTGKVNAGHKYKVRARAVYSAGRESEWTDYSEDIETRPKTPKIQSIKPIGSDGTAVNVNFTKVSHATNYVIEYTTSKSYFDTSPNNVQSVTVDGTTIYSHAEITGLQGDNGTGQSWYFRVKATNNAGGSYWSDIASIVCGTTPEAPTTWSSTATCINGEDVTFYWVHNCEDGSSETSAQFKYKGSGAAAYSPTKSYAVGQYIILNDELYRCITQESAKATKFSTSATYAVNDYVVYDGKIYRCTTAIDTAGEWRQSRWTEGPPRFSTSATYAVNDYVVYDGKIYRCTTAISSAAAWNATKWTEAPSLWDSSKWEWEGDLGWQCDTLDNSYAGNNADPDDLYKTQFYKMTMDLGDVSSGFNVYWKVRTAGITGSYGPWSAIKIVKVYNQPDISIIAVDNDGTNLDNNVCSGFPIHLTLWDDTSDVNQKLIGYHIQIVSKSRYTDTDVYGNKTIIAKGQVLYNKYIDSPSNKTIDGTYYKAYVNYALTPGDVNLRNNKSFKIICTASYNSGLTVVKNINFEYTVQAVNYSPEATITIDPDKLTASIMPSCRTANDQLVSDVLLSVYRHEFDGSFTTIETDIENDGVVTVIDPHPSLNYARYRIVSLNEISGVYRYVDISSDPINEKSIVLQWAESWENYNVVEGEVIDNSEQTNGSSMLKLPYNVDISDKHDPDRALIGYIGRKHPVSYYGTQRGFTSTWNAVIEKSDEETLYAIRRLADYTGDVYVREPSGTGYWATVIVSYSVKHCDLTIPVTFDITRVEGGK